MQSLSEADRSEILRVARAALTKAVLEGRVLQPFPEGGIFSQRRGVFVTLEANRKLRGCIGMARPQEPFGECLVRAAAGAALEDPRFEPVKAHELGAIEIEVSLLSEMLPAKPEEIVVGRDGLLIERGSQRGLLLPQVAVEHHFSRERFLDETCRKAGLPKDCWKDADVQIWRFESEIIP